ncbi:hypothetical protein [Escherichia coli]|uniref:hypothetical protein n=1 Tax=Escherichia coli TaxID=562 RepID=UPI003DA0F093
MNGFRNSSRNGQVWCWQRAGSRAVILEVSGRRMEAKQHDGCRCCATDNWAVCRKGLHATVAGRGMESSLLHSSRRLKSL